MRSQQEIEQHFSDVADHDWLGTKRSDLISYMSFEAAKLYLKEGVTPDEWTPRPVDKEAILAEMLEYMDFAWDKANNNRGLSAGRSLEHMQVWLWMLGEETAAREIDDYSHYGKPQLRAICQKYGWDWTQWDDGRWTSSESGGGVSPDRVDELWLPWNTNNS